MKDISNLYRRLNPEQLKAMEPVLEKRELTLESFKLMRKDYSRIKSRVKAIEKKLLTVMEQAGDDTFVCNWIGREVASIENKYKDIEFAIKHYNVAMKSFHTLLNSPGFSQFNPQEAIYNHGYNPIRNLKSYLYLADGRIDNAVDAMRITERYFKNVASAFKSHANHMVSKKQMEERLRANEMKLLKEQGPEEI